jgi:hypothetical protein
VGEIKLTHLSSIQETTPAPLRLFSGSTQDILGLEKLVSSWPGWLTPVIPAIWDYASNPRKDREDSGSRPRISKVS